MEKRDYYPILESILFTMGKSVEIKTLAEALKLTQEEIKQILQDMAKEYSEKQEAFSLSFWKIVFSFAQSRSIMSI